MQPHYTVVDGLSAFAQVDTSNTSAPPVILLHGLGVSSRYMVPLAEILAAQYRVYAVDMPGFGNSEKPDHILDLGEMADFLARWMDAVGLDRAILFGNSLGCQIIAEFATRYPNRVIRAILLGPTVDHGARTFLKQFLLLVADFPYERLALTGILLQDYWRAGIGRMLQTVHFALCDRIEDKLPEITAPVLIIRGEYDPMVPQCWVEELVKLLPKGQLAVMSNAGHAPNFTHPIRLANLMESFLATPEPMSGVSVLKNCVPNPA